MTLKKSNANTSAKMCFGFRLDCHKLRIFIITCVKYGMGIGNIHTHTHHTAYCCKAKIKITADRRQNKVEHSNKNYKCYYYNYYRLLRR